MEIPAGAPEKRHQVLPVVARVVQLGGPMDKGVEFVAQPGGGWNGVPGRSLGPQETLYRGTRGRRHGRHDAGSS
jgi:hypothetical protein